MSEQPVVITGLRPGLDVRGLDVRGLDRGEIAQANWLCACGHHERARGEDQVRDLCARVRVGHCPHQTAAKEAA